MAKKAIDGFGIIMPDQPEALKLDDRFLEQVTPVLNPETGETTPKVTGKIDTYELIQSYKDSCGMEYVQKMISSGQMSPEDVADDGKHSIDLVGLANNVNDAYRQTFEADKATKKATDDLAKYGIDVQELMKSDDKDGYIKSKLVAYAQAHGDVAKDAPKAQEVK